MNIAINFFVHLRMDGLLSKSPASAGLYHFIANHQIDLRQFNFYL